MKNTLALIFLLVTKFSFSQEVFDYQINNYKIASKHVDEEYQIQVVLPCTSNLNETQKYAVLYVFDADVNFNGFVNSYFKLLKNEQVDSLIIVGVGYGKFMMDNIYRRRRDFTFKESKEDPQMGGGNQFNLFMEKELFPFILKKYSISDKKIAFGHSLAGLYLVYDIYQNTPLFNASIISSNNAFFYQDNIEKERLMKFNSPSTTKVYASVGSSDEKGMLKSLKLLNQWYNKYNVEFDFFETEILDNLDHITSARVAFENGLKKIVSSK